MANFPSNSPLRAAVLAAAVNLGPLAAIDPIRFLRVPAIYFVLTRQTFRICRGRTCRPASRRR